MLITRKRTVYSSTSTGCHIIQAELTLDWLLLAFTTSTTHAPRRTDQEEGRNQGLYKIRPTNDCLLCRGKRLVEHRLLVAATSIPAGHDPSNISMFQTLETSLNPIKLSRCQKLLHSARFACNLNTRLLPYFRSWLQARPIYPNSRLSLLTDPFFAQGPGFC